MKRERVLERKRFAAELAARDAEGARRTMAAPQDASLSCAAVAAPPVRRRKPTRRCLLCGWRGTRIYCSATCEQLADEADRVLQALRDEAADGRWWNAA